MTMNERYIKLDLEAGRVYIRRDRAKTLGMVDAVIFDCDGVLLDVRGSYDEAISKTVVQIFEWLTGCRIPKKLVSKEIIFLFRRSGGFNNDWDIAYGILMFLICNLPKSLRERLEELMPLLLQEKNPTKRLFAARERISADAGKLHFDPPENLAAELKDFTRLLDATGIMSVDRAILESGIVSRAFYNLLRNFLHGSGKVGESIIATVFDEIFCGPILFRETYGFEPAVYYGRGMIENEKLIIKRETLSCLASLLGRKKLGIASGSKFKSAEYILKDSLSWFNPRAQIFLDDVERAESEYAKKGLKVNLKKPNPFSLLESAKGLEPFKLTLYVGDSMEDAIMVNEARKTDPRFLFAGVYKFTSVMEAALREFLKYECDLILPSVNELPAVIEASRRGNL